MSSSRKHFAIIASHFWLMIFQSLALVNRFSLCFELFEQNVQNRFYWQMIYEKIMRTLGAKRNTFTRLNIKNIRRSKVILTNSNAQTFMFNKYTFICYG